MSNNKQSMKLYTEEQVVKMLDLARFTYNSEDKILLSQTPIQLPSDEEIINNLEVSKSNGTIYAYGEISLDEYKKIKAQLK